MVLPDDLVERGGAKPVGQWRLLAQLLAQALFEKAVVGRGFTRNAANRTRTVLLRLLERRRFALSLPGEAAESADLGGHRGRDAATADH